MNVVVFGGSGLIGSRLIERLGRAGHRALSASPRTGVNTLTGDGLDEALAGAQVTVDVTNSPSFEPEEVLRFFETSGRNLLTAARKAGVRHHVALSVVGTDRLPENGYFRAKLAQERVITGSGVPFTILRATQFFEFIGPIAETGASGDAVRVSSAQFQPIAADDVASALAEVVLAPPVNGVIDLAGPEPITMDAAVRTVFEAKGDRRRIEASSDTPYFGSRITDDSLRPIGQARFGATRLNDWLRTHKPA